MSFLFLFSLIIAALYHRSNGFTVLSPWTRTSAHITLPKCRNIADTPSTTALHVWWFGGTSSEQTASSADESCELVAVRIEKPSSNSRKIFGELVVPASLDDVWAVLTDYDRLSTHVPNLVESKILERPSSGEQGNGSYKCRLFQRGAQKIVGFEFGASVTMDMKEFAYDVPFALPPSANGDEEAEKAGRSGLSNAGKRDRRIEFKCVDSFFFNEFDGEWRVVEQTGDNGEVECMLSYVVDVRPRGPVPVAALEWRIREDVPTNLRAVKKAATEVGYEGVLASRVPRRSAPVSSVSTGSPSLKSSSKNGMSVSKGKARIGSSQPATSTAIKNGTVEPTVSAAMNGSSRRKTTAKNGSSKPTDKPKKKLKSVFVQWEVWEETETMAAYLDNN